MNIKTYIVNTDENRFFQNKKEALKDVRSALDFGLDVRLFEIETPSEKYLDEIDGKYSSNVFGKTQSPIEKYFLNECLGSEKCIEITI